MPEFAWTRIETDATELSAGFFLDTGKLADSAFLACLTLEECDSARRMADAGERRHFLMRRAFQRAFVAAVSGWTGELAALPLTPRRDERPHSPAAAGLCLSFSSSGPIALAAAARDGMIGIDVEAVRPIADASGLARRFFSAEEAGAIALLPSERQAEAFQRMWTIKEAALKAIGKGVVYGLDTFAVTGLTVAPPKEFRHGWRWNVTELSVASGYIATLVWARETDPSETC